MHFNMRPRRTHFITYRRVLYMHLTLFLLLVLFMILTHKRQTATQQTNCFLNENKLKAASGIPLEDVLLSDVEPTPERTIFFIDTNCPLKDNILELTARQACSIESAALDCEDFQIFVLFASPRYQESDNKQPLIEAILSYPNVQLRQLQLMRYAAGTPIEDWLKSGQFFKSRYLSSHLADLLRLLTLYRYGGICLHLDVILLNCLHQKGLNYAGTDADNQITTTALSLEATGFGHQFAADCLHDFQQHFDGRNKHNSGAGVIKRVLQKTCNTLDIQQMVNNRLGCRGFQLFNHTRFNGIKSADWRHIFEEAYLDDVLLPTRGKFLLHVWHSKSSEQRIKRGTKAAYAQYARIHCPKSFAAAGEYF